MIRIYSGGERISWTAGDAFSLDVTAADGFEEGTKLNFQVAENEMVESLIDNLYDLKEGGFEILLSDEEKNKLSIGNYIYKLAVIDPNGKIVTRKSGELKVKWGA